MRPPGLSRGQRELGTCIITRAVSIGGSSFGHPSSNRAPPTTSSAECPSERTATAAGADHLVAVAEGKRRFVAQLDGQRNRSQEQIAEAPYLGLPLRPVGSDP